VVIEHYCKGCKQWKPATAFWSKCDRPHGRSHRCAKCLNDERCAKARAAREPRESEAKREADARSLCGTLQTYWHIPVNGPLVGWRIV
jgi:hypothetical protein